MTSNKCSHWCCDPEIAESRLEKEDGIVTCRDCAARWVPSDVLEEALGVLRFYASHVDLVIASGAGEQRVAQMAAAMKQDLARIDAVLGKK